MSDAKNNLPGKNLSPFERLVEIMAILRSDEGCAWDRKQTHRSLLPYLIEEAYEVVEAVDAEDYVGLKEELGDLLCQVVFHAQLAAERGEFRIDDAIESIADKLIARHPHVFSEKKDLKPHEVRDQWEKIKLDSGEKPSALSGLPRTMPALLAAYRMGEKAGGLGFDWHHPAEVVDKLDEEIREIKAELGQNDKDRLTDEIGDLLFATASLARKLDIDPEMALKRALDKFKSRFTALEENVRKSGRKLSDYTLEELEGIWQKIKG